MSKITYFEGEEGYYYNQLTNSVWLIKNKIEETYMDIKTLDESKVCKYDININDKVILGQVVIVKEFEQALFLSDWRDDG